METWLLLFLLAASTLASEDLAGIAAGALVAQGKLAFWPAVFACFAGIWIGDLAIVALGRVLGAPALARPPMRWWISPAGVARAETWFARRGGWLLFASRFLPGTRVPIYFTAGSLRQPWLSTAVWTAVACALWTPLLVGVSAGFGHAGQQLLSHLIGVVPVILLSAAAAWLVARTGIALGSHKGRRLLLGRWRRTTRWEYWPRWAVYAPVAAYILWLALKHRSLLLVTAANPGIERGGGISGESKSGILAGLASAGPRVAPWCLIQPGVPAVRVGRVRDFMAREGLSFPVVLKPDVGARGTGVVIADNAEQVATALAREPAALIAQVYVPGLEFGVFYHRAPSAQTGDIFAITEKRMPHVTGDGARTLEELILQDDRAVAMAPFFFAQFAGQLDRVPARGESIALTRLGTHCRGALFLDGTHHTTPELREAVDRVSRALRGFHFGRYDVRTPSLESFRRGEFTVIELNGLTSEATNIYDPRHSVWSGWATLCRQWRLAFAIAAENRAAGTRPLALREVVRLFQPSPTPT